MTETSPNHSLWHWPFWISALLLCGAAAESTQFRAPPNTSQYRALVRQTTLSFPATLGDWQGRSVEVEPSAVRLLRPNVMLSRQYYNAKTGQQVGFLFVDCQDARDTIGHFPPICYPAEGWSQQTATVTDWKLPRMTIHGTEYTFVRGIFDSSGTIVVDDFFVLPALGTAPNRDGVIAAARDLQRRFYGVAQVQLVFRMGSAIQWTAEQREKAFTDLIGPMQGLMQTVENIDVKQSRDASNSDNGAMQQ